MCVFKGTSKANAAAELKRDRRNKRAREGGNSRYDADRNGGGAGAGMQNGFEDAVRFPGRRCGLNSADRAFLSLIRRRIRGVDRKRRSAHSGTHPYERWRLTSLDHLQILLLSGPPGLGKTTLAHVLARQAGYQVLEINASDDRTGRVVEDRIRNALDSQALTSGAGLNARGKAKASEEGRSRPTCVVVDEIDGAAGGGESVRRSLVLWLLWAAADPTASDRASSRPSSSSSPKEALTKNPPVSPSLPGRYDQSRRLNDVRRAGKGKGKQPRPLLRPIICICNDLCVLLPWSPIATLCPDVRSGSLRMQLCTCPSPAPPPRQDRPLLSSDGPHARQAIAHNLRERGFVDREQASVAAG